MNCGFRLGDLCARDLEVGRPGAGLCQSQVFLGLCEAGLYCIVFCRRRRMSLFFTARLSDALSIKCT
jgi:hypothetical protein